MLGLRRGEVKHGAVRLVEVPFPGEAPSREPEEIWCSSSSIGQGVAPVSACCYQGTL